MAEQNGSDPLTKRFPHLAPDDDLLKVMDWGRELEIKVDDFAESLNIWTQAILKQTDLASRQNDLIVSQNLILQKTGQTNESLGLTLTRLKQGLSELQKEFKSLKEAISGQESTLQSLSAQSQSLSSKLDDLSLKLETLQTLNTKVDSLTTNLETLTTSVSKITRGLTFDRWLTRSALSILVILILIQSLALRQWGMALQPQIEQVHGNVNTALLRLKRLEER